METTKGDGVIRDEFHGLCKPWAFMSEEEKDPKKKAAKK